MTWAELLRDIWFTSINADLVRHARINIWLAERANSVSFLFIKLSKKCTARARAYLDLVDNDY